MTYKELKVEVYKNGYNIYSYINAFKKRQKLREDLPDEIYMQTCMDFLTYKDKIHNPFPYFQRMMKENSRNYFASQNQGHKEVVNHNLLGRLGLCQEKENVLQQT